MKFIANDASKETTIMPNLDWAGKAEAVAAAKGAAYRLLLADESLSYGDLSAGNAIVQGDNLDALKSLLPYYAGRVRCVYIDKRIAKLIQASRKDKSSKALDIRDSRIFVLRRMRHNMGNTI